MPRYKLNPSLAAKVQAELERDPDEQLAIFEELALVRIHTNDYVQLYSAAVEAEDVAMRSGEIDKIQSARDRRARAGMLMGEAIQMVTDTCAKAMKIQNAQKDRFSVHDIKYILAHIARICESVVGEQNPYLAEKFMRTIEEDLTIPRISAVDKGTQLSIDETAAYFDQSVPVVHAPTSLDEDDEDDYDGEQMA